MCCLCVVYGCVIVFGGEFSSLDDEYFCNVSQSVKTYPSVKMSEIVFISFLDWVAHMAEVEGVRLRCNYACVTFHMLCD